MQGMSVLAVGVTLGAAPDAKAGVKQAGVRDSAYKLDEKNTPYKDVTTYNNFYEFGTGKDDPADRAGSLKTRPWTAPSKARCAVPRPGTSPRC
jgi:sulfoxide reductase catalytic subunit YedY